MEQNQKRDAVKNNKFNRYNLKISVFINNILIKQ